MRAAAPILFLALLPCNGSLSASFWPSGISSDDLSKVHFPEETIPSVLSKPNTGLSFVGGGNRASCSESGFLRGLNHLGLIPKVRYLSTISGGSWASSSFVFRQTQLTNNEFLGPIMPPAQLSPNVLQTAPGNGTLLATVTDVATFAANLEQAAAGKIPFTEDLQIIERWAQLAKPSDWPALFSAYENASYDGLDLVWQRGIEQLILNAVGIPQGAYFALNETTKAQIVKMNPLLKNAPFVLPYTATGNGSDMPFLIMGGSILGPSTLAPFVPFNLSTNGVQSYLTRLEMTPMYVGVPFARNVTYTQNMYKNNPPQALAENSLPGKTSNSICMLCGTTSTVATSGFVQPFAFGGQSSTDAFLLESAVGISSLFVGAVLAALTPTTGASQILPKSSTLPFYKAVAAFDLSSYNDYSQTSNNTTSTPSSNAGIGATTEVGTNTPRQNFLFADGGSLENTGIISLLQRRVANIIVFDANGASHSPVTGTKPPPGFLATDTNLNSLFGVDTAAAPLAATGFSYNNNKVFSSSDYNKLYSALSTKIANGEAAIVSMPLTTVENSWWGIPAGLRVNLTWVFVTAPDSWLNMLPVDTQKMIRNTSDPSAAFWNFPFYSTTLQGALTVEQANALSQLTTSLVLDNAEIFEAVLSSTVSPTPAPSSSSSMSAGDVVGICIGGLVCMVGAMFGCHMMGQRRSELHMQGTSGTYIEMA